MASTIGNRSDIRGIGRAITGSLALSFFAFFASIACAQSYPSKPVRVIAPFPQGRHTGSRRGGWCWGGDGVRAPGLWHGVLRWLVAVLGAGVLICALPVDAQPYPSKPVRVIAPFPPGAGVDIVTRIFTPKLAEALGQQFIVDNRSGAAGHIGAELAARAAPDGYTLLLAPSSIVISRTLYPKLAYNIEKDLDPITQVAAAPFVLVVHPSLPVRNVKELIALAKSKPGQLFYASTGNGGSPHLAMEVFRMQAKINVVHVPYKGTPPAVTDLIAGQVSLMFANTLSVLPFVHSGRLRALALSSAKRSAAAPELPTVAESGMPGFDVSTWFGLFAPAGTPREIINRLNGEVRKIGQMPNVRELLRSQGADPLSTTPEEFRAFISAELVKWAKAVQAAGVRTE